MDSLLRERVHGVLDAGTVGRLIRKDRVFDGV
jgi:hypothetical protein